MKRQTPGTLLKVGIGMIVAAAIGFLASRQSEHRWPAWLSAVLLVNGLADITVAAWMTRREPAVSAPRTA